MSTAAIQNRFGIVIPCYNEEKRLKISSFVEFLKNNREIFIVFVNDGSTDNTYDLLQKIDKELPENTHLIDQKNNLGKAEAIRNGVGYLLENDRTCFIGYWDSDLSAPLSEIPNFIDLLSAQENLQLIMGSRIKRLGAEVRRSEFRHYFGRIFATAVSIILNLPVYDTQCGAKLMRRETAKIIFRDPFVSHWFFDVELIARIIGAFGYPRTMDCIFELPLSTWIDDGQSKVKMIDFLRTPLELLRIRNKYKAVLK